VPQAESTVTNQNSSYEQETWVVKLPSVLFICLNRYKFSKATQSSSKILEPFEFYPHIYLDRYMYSNREAIKAKRKELQQLNSDMKLLKEKLDHIKAHQFRMSGDTCKQFALDDAFKCVYEFMASREEASKDLLK